MDSLRVLLLLLLLSFCSAQYQESICHKALSCAECVRTSERCGWCADEFFHVHCDDLQSLAARNCRKIENPRGIFTIEKNLPLTNTVEKLKPEQIIQIQPQKISLSLRSGEPQTFSLKFRRAEDYPIDLYFLVDLSLSMQDDLLNMKKLGRDLMKEMQEITSDFRIGLGVIEPQTPDPTCSRNLNCPRTFTFRNLLKLTANGDELDLKLSQLQISESTEAAEGGVDSNVFLQVALCEEQIGWRDAVRLLVVSTDNSVRLHRNQTPETPQCQLQNDSYTYTQIPDPPLEQGPRTRPQTETEWAVSLWASKLIQHNIQSAFVVPENLLPLYQELKYQIPKSTVGTRWTNSSNVPEIIMETSKSLLSEVYLENTRLPEGFYISYKSLCKNGVEGLGERGRQCSNVSIGDEVLFEVSIAVQKCPDQSKVEEMKIKPLGFQEEVEVLLNYCISECECSAKRQPHSLQCSSSGTLECGACRCDPGWVGPLCDCSMDRISSTDMDETCRATPTSAVCSDNGDCVCGSCECKRRENPEERYSGQFCECDNFNCDRSNNRLCGGHGRCECRQCICDRNWTGSACDCSLEVTSCLATNGQICNGRGICQCGSCKCTDPKFQGPTCEMCPTCPGVCTIQTPCVQCRAFGSGPKSSSCQSDCNYLTLTRVQDRESLPQPSDNRFPLVHCKERDENDCWFYFTYARRDGREEVHVVQSMDCPPPPSLLDILG